MKAKAISAFFAALAAVGAFMFTTGSGPDARGAQASQWFECTDSNCTSVIAKDCQEDIDLRCAANATDLCDGDQQNKNCWYKQWYDASAQEWKTVYPCGQAPIVCKVKKEKCQ